MFDWDNQELVDILWAEADDHIVPIPRGSEENPIDVSENLIKKEVGSWNKSLANVPKNSWDKPANFASCSQNFQDPYDDKESDLVGYDWDSIGSFDDLDRIFSNGDPEFGCTSLGDADELWSSSMDYSSLASGAPSTTEKCGKTEDMLDQAQPFSLGYSNINDLTCCVPQNKHVTMNHLRHAEFENNLFAENKMDRQKNMLRRSKRSGEESKARPYQDLPKIWFSPENQFQQLDGHYAKTGQSPEFLGINRQIKLQEPAFSPYNVTPPLFSPSGHAHMHLQDPVTPIVPQFHSASKVRFGKSKTSNGFPGSLVNPLTMTSEEKIKKLRQRQQLRAMLAIQKQQKQFGHETSEFQHSVCQKHSIPDQMQILGGNLEVDVPTLDMNSPAEQDYSGTMSFASDDCSPEDSILYRLQNIVAKLDIQLRLCIRDSLCRLAQSATQRQYAKDTHNSKKRSGGYVTYLQEENTNTDNRFAGMPERETDTNPIDRTVAHLLFDRSIEFSENLEKAKMHQERTSTNLLPIPRGILAENCNSIQTRSDVALEGLVCAEVGMSKSSFCVKTSEYASKCEEVQKKVTEVQPLTNSLR